MPSHLSHIVARLDWLDIEVSTKRPSNFQTVQRAFDKALSLPTKQHVHVTPIAPNPGGGASRFIVRLHDVERYTDLVRIVRGAGQHIPLDDTFALARIEVAVDAYGANPAELTVRRFLFLERPVSKNRRIFRTSDEITQDIPATSNALERHIADGWQIGIGNKTDDIYQHAYVKDTDTRNGTRVQIEPCSRSEIRISQAGLEAAGIDADIMTFKFEKLARYFTIKQPRKDLSRLDQAIVESRAHAFGERKVRNRREGGTRLFGRLTKTDLDFNQNVRAALRGLSKRWTSTSNRGRPSGHEQRSACGKKEQIQNSSLCIYEEKGGISNNYIRKAMVGSTASPGSPDMGASNASVDREASIPSLAMEDSKESQASTASQGNQAADEGLRPVPASPSPTARAIPVTSETADAMTEPAAPHRDEGWPYPDPW